MTKAPSQRKRGTLASHAPLSCLRRAESPGRGAGSSSGAPGDTCKGEGAKGPGGQPQALQPSRVGREGLAFRAEKFGLDPAFNGKSQEAFFISFLHFFFNVTRALGKCLNRTKRRKGEK